MNIDIFVSSTFQDFHFERDLLHRKIIKLTNELLHSRYGDNVSFIDLRWGIDTSKATKEDVFRKVLSICIPFVQESKPFFILFLGDSYGTIADTAILREIYQSHGLVFDGRERSITEAEIDASSLFQGDSSHCLLLERTLVGIAPEYEAIYKPKHEQEKLQALKKRIHTLIPQDNTFYYQATVDRFGKLRFLDEDALCHFLSTTLVRLMGENSRIKKIFNAPSSNEVNQEIFEGFFAKNEKIFYGREDETNQALEAMARGGNYKFTSPSGGGKSSLLAHISTILRNKGNIVFSFFPSISYTSPSFKNVIHHFCYLLGEKQPETDSLWELRLIFSSLLRKLNPGKQYIFVIDALDQIADSHFFQSLIFDPTNPAYVHFLLSEATDNSGNLSSLKQEDVLPLIIKRLSYARRELSHFFIEGFETLNDKKKEALRFPAFLSLVLDKLLAIDYAVYSALASKRNELKENFSFDRELAKIFIDLISNTGKNLKEEYQRRFRVIEQADPTSLDGLLAIAVSYSGLTIEDVVAIGRSEGKKISVAFLAGAIRSFSNEISFTHYGRYKVTHQIFQTSLFAFCGKERVMQVRGNLINARLAISPVLDEQFVHEIILQTIQTKQVIYLSNAFNIILLEANEEHRQRFYDIINDEIIGSLSENGSSKLLDVIAEGINKEGTDFASSANHSAMIDALYTRVFCHRSLAVNFRSLSFFESVNKYLLTKDPDAIPQQDIHGLGSFYCDYIGVLAANGRYRRAENVLDDKKDLMVKKMDHQDGINGGLFMTLIMYLTLMHSLRNHSEVVARYFEGYHEKSGEELLTIFNEKCPEEERLIRIRGQIIFILNISLHAYLADANVSIFVDQVFLALNAAQWLIASLPDDEPQKNYLALGAKVIKLNLRLNKLQNQPKTDFIQEAKSIKENLKHYQPHYYFYEDSFLLLGEMAVFVSTLFLAGEQAIESDQVGKEAVNLANYLFSATKSPMEPILLFIASRAIDYISPNIIGLGYTNFGKTLSSFLLQGLILSEKKDLYFGPVTSFRLWLILFWYGAYVHFGHSSDKDRETYKYILEKMAEVLPPRTDNKKAYADWFRQECTNLRQRIEILISMNVPKEEAESFWTEITEPFKPQK